MKFILINDVDVIVNMWPMIAPGLRKDLEHKTDGSTEEHVYQRLLSKQIFMVQVFVNDEFRGFITLAKNWSKKDYVCLFNIFYDGRWTPEEWESFEDFLKKDPEIKGVQFFANRKAFARRLECVGYKEGSIELYKEF